MDQEQQGHTCQPELWVAEGCINLPIFFSTPLEHPGKGVVGLRLDYSGFTGDGFIELNAADPIRIQSSVWVSTSEPVPFKFRASVLASSLGQAWQRSQDFIYQMLDRLTFLGGSPATLIQRGVMYSETQLAACKRGERTTFEMTTGGEYCWKSQPAANLHIAQQLRPSDRAKRALRWLRKAMTFEHVEDRFLGYYFTLECISNDIAESVPRTHTCQSCGCSTGISKAQTEGIKHLIARHPELPKDLFRQLGRVRGKLVHGADIHAQDEAASLESIVRLLAAEGIAISLRVDPASVQLFDTSRPEILPICLVDYDPENNPVTMWGQSIESFLDQTKQRWDEAEIRSVAKMKWQ